MRLSLGGARHPGGDAIAIIPTHICEQLEASGWPISSAELTGTQGTRSDTYQVACADRSAILKLYNQRGGTPAEKCAREWCALGEFQGMPRIPQRLAREPDGWILMERLPGQTLRSRWTELDGPLRQRLCIDLGSSYARFALAPQNAQAHQLVLKTRPFRWLDDMEAAFPEIERALGQQERLESPTFKRAAARLRILSGASKRAPLLFKADCNVDNTLVNGSAISGIVDWEESCLADRWILLGIVLDHTHFLDWSAVRHGLEEVAGAWSREEEELVLAAGFLCMWRKLIRMQPGTHWYTQTAAQEARLHAMAAAMGRPDILRP